MAVLAVIAYHLNLGWAPGGLLGVVVFFVLSGYLITDLLVGEGQAEGRLSLGNFWRRRARRLLPALGLMLAAVTAWAGLAAPSLLPTLRGDDLAALLYVSNWWFLLQHASYFARFGPPAPLGHLWSLAIEEQFYLAWPVVLSLGLGRWPGPRRLGLLAGGALAAAAASALAMALLYRPGGDPSRVYDGTDTRAFSLLLGAALALGVRSCRGRDPWPHRPPWLGQAGGALGLGAVCLLVVALPAGDPFLYRGGMVLASLGSALAVAALRRPGGALSRVLSWRPLRWLGVRSYGIYLWHYPVILLMPPLSGGLGGALRIPVEVGATLALAAFSFRYLEAPIRRRGFRATWRSWVGAWKGSSRSRARAAVAACAGAAPVLLAGMGLMGLTGRASALSPSLPARILPTALGPQGAWPQGGRRDPFLRQRNPKGRAAGGSAAAERPPHRADGAPHTPRGAAAHPPAGACRGVTAIGDSILIDAAPYLRRRLPGIVIDAAVGRQMVQAPAVIARLRARGLLGGCVVLELGTNGPFSPATLAAVWRALGPVQRIVLVNVRVPRPWQGEVNRLLAEAGRRPRTVRVNWYAASAHRPEDFWPDGVHPDPRGARLYARLILEALLRPAGGVIPQ